LKNFSAPVARLAAFPVSFDYPTSDFSPWTSGPMRIRFAAGVFKNVDLRGGYGKQGINRACV